MRISWITVWQLDLPLSHPYFLSGGRLRFDRLDSSIVRIDTDSGISWLGRGLPLGPYLSSGAWFGRSHRHRDHRTGADRHGPARNRPFERRDG